MLLTMKKLLFISITLLALTLSAIENELNVAITNTDLTLNPFYTYSADEAQYLTGIYEGLVSYDPRDLTPKPGLAESWTLSEDKMTYTFKLREDIYFSNGDKITAEIYKNTLLKLLNPDTHAEFASLLDIIKNAQEYRNGIIDSPESIGIRTDGNNLIIELKKRAPYFTKILCHHSFTPIHPSLLNKKEWSVSELKTTGAYTLEKQKNRLILTKNEKYWDKDNVYFNTINLIDYKDSEKATNDYNSGKIDWLTDSTINLNKISDTDTLKVNPLFATTYYYFNPTYKEYANSEIRRAISLLIPWNIIRTKQYIPANSLIPNLTNFPKNSKNYEQNIDMALEILEKEGFKNGKGLSNIVISIPENTYNDEFISEVVKKNIEENTEITVEVIKNPYPQFFTVNREIEFTISTLSWIGDFADPLTFLEMWTTNSNLNDSGFSQSDYDLIVENSSNLTQDERYKELSKAEKILLDENIVIPINHSPGINVIDTRYIENWYANTLDIHPYKYLRITNTHVIPGLI